MPPKAIYDAAKLELVFPYPALGESAQQLRQLGDVGGDAPGLVAGQQVSRRSPAGLLLEIDLDQRAWPFRSLTIKQAALCSSMNPGGRKRRRSVTPDVRP
jgi:hypothetical protein